MAERQSFFLRTASHSCETAWCPPVDVYHGESGWLVKCDLAGVRPEDVETTISGRRLTIAGARRDLSVVSGHRAYSLEIAYDRFRRTIELPCDIERAELNMDYRDGMLLIAIKMKCD